MTPIVINTISSCHVTQMMCATSPITLTLTLKLTLAMEPNSLSSRARMHSFRTYTYSYHFACATSSMACGYTYAYNWMLHLHTSALSHQNPYPSACAYILIFSHSFSMCCVPPSMCTANDGWCHISHHLHQFFNLQHPIHITEPILLLSPGRYAVDIVLHPIALQILASMSSGGRRLGLGIIDGV